VDFDGNGNGHGSQGATVPLDTRQGVATALAATFEEFLRDCSAAGPGCAFSPGDPEAKWAVLAARSRGAPVTTVDGRRWTYPEIIADTLARPTSYPQLAELLQQLYDTGTATPELLNAVTGSEATSRTNRPTRSTGKYRKTNAIRAQLGLRCPSALLRF
jgi:hypothetical protein